MYQDVMEWGLEFLFYYIRRSLKTKHYLKNQLLLHYIVHIMSYNTVGLLTENNHSKTYIMLFVKILKVIQ